MSDPLPARPAIKQKQIDAILNALMQKVGEIIADPELHEQALQAYLDKPAAGRTVLEVDSDACLQIASSAIRRLIETKIMDASRPRQLEVIDYLAGVLSSRGNLEDEPDAPAARETRLLLIAPNTRHLERYKQTVDTARETYLDNCEKTTHPIAAGYFESAAVPPPPAAAAPTHNHTLAFDLNERDIRLAHKEFLSALVDTISDPDTHDLAVAHFKRTHRDRRDMGVDNDGCISTARANTNAFFENHHSLVGEKAVFKERFRNAVEYFADQYSCSPQQHPIAKVVALGLKSSYVDARNAARAEYITAGGVEPFTGYTTDTSINGVTAAQPSSSRTAAPPPADVAAEEESPFDFLTGAGDSSPSTPAASAPSAPVIITSAPTANKKKGKDNGLVKGLAIGALAVAGLGTTAYVMNNHEAPQANVRQNGKDEDPAPVAPRGKKAKPRGALVAVNEGDEVVVAPPLKPVEAVKPAAKEKPKGDMPEKPAAAADPADPKPMAAAPAAADVEPDPTTLKDADERRAHFEKYEISRILDVSPQLLERGFFERDGDGFKVPERMNLECYKVNAKGDIAWTIYEPATDNLAVVVPADSTIKLALVADKATTKGHPSYHLETINGLDRTRLTNAEGKTVDYQVTTVKPTHMLHATGKQLFEGKVPGIHIAARYSPSQVNKQTNHVLDNARSQRPEVELRIPLNNQVVYLNGGVTLDLENAMAMPTGATKIPGRPSSRSPRGVAGEPLAPINIPGMEDAYVVVENSGAASIIKRPKGSIDTDTIDGNVSYDAINKNYVMEKVGQIGWQAQVPCATSEPSNNAGVRDFPHADGHIGLHVLMNPKGVKTSVLYQIAGLPVSTQFSGGPARGLQGASARDIISVADSLLERKAEPYTLNELSLAISKWGRMPDQLADILQKAAYARGTDLRPGSFGETRTALLGNGAYATRELTNLTEKYDPEDPASKTILEKYRDVSLDLVEKARKRGRETVAAAKDEADPWKKAELMGFKRPEDPADDAPDAEKAKTKALQAKVDRAVKDLVDFGTKSVGKAGDTSTSDVVWEYMRKHWLPREGQLIINPGQHDRGIDLSDEVAAPVKGKKTTSTHDGSDARNIADAGERDPNLGRGQLVRLTEREQLINELGLGTGASIPQDPIGDFTARLRNQMDERATQIAKDEQPNKGPRGRFS